MIAVADVDHTVHSGSLGDWEGVTVSWSALPTYIT